MVAEKKITFQELYMHNADGDMETLLDIYNHKGKEVMNRVIISNIQWLDELECSALVRMMDDGEIIMGHATWRNFAAMLRHYKFYEFHYGGEEIRLSFSASPGFINSKDDFYVNGYGIGAMETTNGIYDDDLDSADADINVPRNKTWRCTKCGANRTECLVCNGEGHYFSTGFGIPREVKCEHCNGTKICPQSR